MAAETSVFVQLYGLEVREQGSYAEYRARMAPFLQAHGGTFGIDLEVARVLRAPTNAALNRVFTLEFPNRAASAQFFADDAYRAVRGEWFEHAVARVLLLAEWVEARGAGTDGADVAR